MIRMEDIQQVVHGKIICVAGNCRKTFDSEAELFADMTYKNFIIVSISSENDSIVLELRPWQAPATDTDAEWVRKYKEQNGFDPSYF